VHSRTASTTWLDLSLAVEQARALRDALIELLPEREEPLRARFAELEQDLSELDTRLAAAAAQDVPLLASHPIYQYLARRYALDIHSVHWEPDEHPSPEQWSELEDLLRSHPARWMLWEGPPREETVAALAALGVGSVVFSPCGNTTEGSDFLRVMAQNVESLRATQGPPADAGADR
jgi:zinc transport system substrate-binding protein